MLSLQGDTWDLLSQRFYGTPDQAALLRSANPGVTEPMQAGIEITTPELGLSGTQVSDVLVPTDAPAIIVDSQPLDEWTDVTIDLSVESPARFSFSGPIQSIGDAVRPFEYQLCDITYDGKSVTQGTIVSVDPSVRAGSANVSIGGYAQAGVLGDCTISADQMDKTQFNGMDLQQIANQLCSPFGLVPSFPDGPGPVFGKAAAESTGEEKQRLSVQSDAVSISPNQKIGAFLAKLARQRGLIMSSDIQGQPLFLRPLTDGFIVANLEENAVPLISVRANFRPQIYYSHITSVSPARMLSKGSKATVKNPRLTRFPSVFRPHAIIDPDVDDGEIEASANAAIGRMFGNAVSYIVSVAGWTDDSGNLWQPNTFLNLLAPSALIREPYTFMVKAVNLIRSDKQETANLTLVLPGSYAGEIPDVLPWEV